MECGGQSVRDVSVVLLLLCHGVTEDAGRQVLSETVLQETANDRFNLGDCGEKCALRTAKWRTPLKLSDDLSDISIPIYSYF
jgi:hypothetical protein